MALYGGMEAGGTKFACAVGTSPDDIRASARFATRSPGETLAEAVAFFRAQPERIAAVGIGSFGPIDPRIGSPTYGQITSTPKKGWAYTSIVDEIGQCLGVPVAFDTDVNAAALAEHTWGVARGKNTFLYLTVGTGIGGGAIVHGHRLHGALHPEMGHVFVPRAPGDVFAGCCPYHGDCLEGMASGPAIAARWGQPGASLPPAHPAWQLEAHYLGLAIIGFILALAPECVILGGGVMKQQQLFPMIRATVQRRLNDYYKVPAITQSIATFIVPPALGDDAGVLGGIALAATVS